MDDALRRRYKYLGHVPEGANVVFVEAENWEDVVGSKTVMVFELPLRMRKTKRREKKRRKERARLERRRERNERGSMSMIRESRLQAATVHLREMKPINRRSRASNRMTRFTTITCHHDLKLQLQVKLNTLCSSSN